MKKVIQSIIISLLFIPLFFSCASLPRATADLSILLDKQLSTLEQYHIAIIDKYFKEKQYHVLTFLDNEWYPKYLENFFKDENAAEIWDAIINNPDKQERISDLQMVVSVIQSEYMAMRDSLLIPLETTRRELINIVHDEYNTARTMNNAVLNNIVSVTEIQEARSDYLSKVIDINSVENKIGSHLNRMDNVLNDAKTWISKYNDSQLIINTNSK